MPFMKARSGLFQVGFESRWLLLGRAAEAVGAWLGTEWGPAARPLLRHCWAEVGRWPSPNDPGGFQGHELGREAAKVSRCGSRGQSS